MDIYAPQDWYVNTKVGLSGDTMKVIQMGFGIVAEYSK